MLGLLLLTLHFFSAVDALPFQTSESRVIIGTQDSTPRQSHNQWDFKESYSSDATFPIAKPANVPVVVRCSSVDNRGDGSKTYVFKPVTDKQISSTSSMFQGETWICREQPDSTWSRPWVLSAPELSMDAYSESVLFWRGIAVLLITMALTIFALALLCIRSVLQM